MAHLLLSSSSQQQFHLFPLLPSELRLKIYDHMLALCLPAHKPNTSSIDAGANTNNKKEQLEPETAPHSSRRILKISYTPSLRCYISNVPPPVPLSISSESRAYGLERYKSLLLGSTPSPIPISFSHDTLYISSLLPLLASPSTSDLLYGLSTTSSRHRIQSLALDLRVWHDLCEDGLLGVLAGMRGLREVCLVVEFGRREFRGEVGFLRLPGWRRDLVWVAERAEEGIERERMRVRGLRGERGGVEGEVEVRCVLLTRGGEQA